MSNIIKYNIDNQTRYLMPGGTSITEQELEDLEKKYFEKGYKERMAGYYDKFYRYTTFDKGASYDAGCMKACETKSCPSDCIIIEYNH